MSVGEKVFTILLAGAAVLCAAMPATAGHPAALTETEAEALGTEIYIYGYPLVTMDMTRQVMTNSATAEALKAPMGQFSHARLYPDASFVDVPAQNVDTLYSSAWLNLAKEPYILHLPEEKDHYYLMPLLSGWTNVFSSLGTRTTGTKEADYAITGPSFKERLPAHVKEVKSPTDLVWILGRTYCSGSAEDYKLVHAIQDRYTLTPLSSFGKPYTNPKGIVDAKVDMKTAVRNQVNKLNAAAYFNKLALLLKENPPAAADAPMVAIMAQLGIIPGKEYDVGKFDKNVIEGLERGIKLAQEQILSALINQDIAVNGWVMVLNTGEYGTNYLKRAAMAATGLGANLSQDAVYPKTSVDSNGEMLSGAHSYVLHFTKEDIPPVKGFWSLTMYDDEYFFVPNDLHRYTLSPRNALKYNNDGSLDVYIQSTWPGKEKESNWLPAPLDRFILMLRLYWPETAVLDGTWKPPAVHRTAP